VSLQLPGKGAASVLNFWVTDRYQIKVKGGGVPPTRAHRRGSAGESDSLGISWLGVVWTIMLTCV